MTVSLKVHKALERSQCTVVVQRIADTGALVVRCGPRLMKQLNRSSRNLNRGNSLLKRAESLELSVIGTIPVNIQFNGASSSRTTVQTLHMVQGLDKLFSSRTCLVNLRCIDASFPLPTSKTYADHLNIICESALCGCLKRCAAPEPQMP